MQNTMEMNPVTSVKLQMIGIFFAGKHQEGDFS